MKVIRIWAVLLFSDKSSNFVCMKRLWMRIEGGANHPDWVPYNLCQNYVLHTLWKEPIIFIENSNWILWNMFQNSVLYDSMCIFQPFQLWPIFCFQIKQKLYFVFPLILIYEMPYTDEWNVRHLVLFPPPRFPETAELPPNVIRWPHLPHRNSLLHLTSWLLDLGNGYQALQPVHTILQRQERLNISERQMDKWMRHFFGRFIQ